MITKNASRNYDWNYIAFAKKMLQIYLIFAKFAPHKNKMTTQYLLFKNQVI